MVQKSLYSPLDGFFSWKETLETLIVKRFHCRLCLQRFTCIVVYAFDCTFYFYYINIPRYIIEIDWARIVNVGISTRSSSVSNKLYLWYLPNYKTKWILSLSISIINKSAAKVRQGELLTPSPFFKIYFDYCTRYSKICQFTCSGYISIVTKKI